MPVSHSNFLSVYLVLVVSTFVVVDSDGDRHGRRIGTHHLLLSLFSGVSRGEHKVLHILRRSYLVLELMVFNSPTSNLSETNKSWCVCVCAQLETNRLLTALVLNLVN